MVSQFPVEGGVGGGEPLCCHWQRTNQDVIKERGEDGRLEMPLSTEVFPPHHRCLSPALQPRGSRPL